jgi:type I restriction enzyme M protein
MYQYILVILYNSNQIQIDDQREWTEKNNQAGFCFSADLATMQKHDFVLTPGRYVGAEAEEDDGILFADKMAALAAS